MVPLAADERIDRIPVGPAQLGEPASASGAAGSTAWATRLQWVVGKPPGLDSFIMGAVIREQTTAPEWNRFEITPVNLLRWDTGS